MQVQILFRADRSSLKEEEVAKSFGYVINKRSMVQAKSLVVPRYSLLPFAYETLEDIKCLGGTPINDYNQYLYVADLKNWVNDLKDFTPKTYSDFYLLSDNSSYVIKGETKRQTVSKNWQFWGAKGLFVSHFTFEWGVASLAKPLNFKDSNLSSAQIKHAKNVGLMEYIKENALELHSLNMYDRFLARGWSVKLSHDVRKKLCPIIIQTIAMAWILAIDGAESQ